MAAAYAGLVSVMNILDQIQNHPRHLISLDKKQIESLLEKVGFLLDFIENSSHGGGSEEAEAEVLESQIASAAYAAEDVIESHVVDQILACSTTRGDQKTSPSFLLELQKVIEDMESIKEKVMLVKEKAGFEDQQPEYAAHATLPRTLTAGKNTMVGFDEDLLQLMERLVGQQSNRQIIPIVGMGGIGC